jgi:hypothetical protein
LELAQWLLNHGRDQQGVIILTLAAMEQEITAHGWDQPPWLYLLYRQLPDRQTADELAEKDVRAQQMSPRPLGALRADHPGDVELTLHFLAEEIKTSNEIPHPPDFFPPLGDDLVAWVLVTEGWAAAVDDRDQTAVARLRKAAKEHTIHKRADHFEARHLLAVDRAMVRYNLIRVRDREIIGAMCDEEGDVVIGTLIEALAELMAVTP